MNKDEAIDRLLRRTIPASANPRPSEPCLDSEALAAWQDGSLSAAQRAAAESHAADCDRCLTLLAAMARTSPPSVAQPPSWFAMRWLVPLTTAAVAFTAWVALQEPQRTPTGRPDEATQATDTQERRQAQAAETQAPGDTQEKQRQNAAGKTEATEESPTKLRELGRAPKRQASADAERKRLGERDAGLRRTDALTKAQPQPSAPAANDGRARRPAPAAPPPAPARDAMGLPPPSKPRAERADESPQFRAAAQVSPTVILSPDPNVRWRIGGAAIERSTDNGRTWITQTTNTAGALRAGASPAREVCWIVGRGGLVLLSTDGQTWRRLEFPDASVDLVAVTAVDGTTATVTSADGRTYRTTNAGRIWSLQETPAAPF